MRISFALFLLLPLCSCLNPSMRAYVAYMNLSPDGDMGLEDVAATRNVNGIRGGLGTEFDLGDSSTPYVRLDYETDAWNVELSGFQYEDSGSSVLTSAYGDIKSGTSVNSELRFSNVKLGILTDVVDVGPVEVSAGMAFSYMDVDMDVASFNNLSYEESNFQAPVPMLYVRGAVDTGVVRGELSLAWIEADVADVQGLFFDADATVVFSPVPALDVFAGYRYINMDVDGKLDGQQFTTNTQLSGWYLGAGITF